MPIEVKLLRSEDVSMSKPFNDSDVQIMQEQLDSHVLRILNEKSSDEAIQNPSKRK